MTVAFVGFLCTELLQEQLPLRFPSALEAAEIAGYTCTAIGTPSAHGWQWPGPASSIQKAAGHRAIAMSARYSHLSPEHTLSVVDRIAGTASGNQHAPKHAPENLAVIVRGR
jgi:hypothetical protein